MRARMSSLVFAAFLTAEAADPWSKAMAKRGIDPGIATNPIAITPEIRSAADLAAGGSGGTVDQLRRIQSALYDGSRFTFDYDAGRTATAAEALAAGRGNCVAFTNLFIAMARARGIPVRAGYVTPRGAGEKRGDLVYVESHVVAVYQLHDRRVVFDFYRMKEDPGTRIRPLDDFELAALYLNNRAVEALRREEFRQAEVTLDAVLKLAPEFAEAYGNLGVLRRRAGNVPGALDAYRRALALSPEDPAILGNLATLYYGIGREREAKAALALADLDAATPYVILARGDLEAADGRVEAALRFYRKAARRAPRLVDPQLSIARLALLSGRIREARHASRRALELDPGNAEAEAISRAVRRS